MKRLIFIVLSLVFVSFTSAQDFKLVMGPVVSNYSSQWPNVIFAGWQGETSSLNPFDNHKTGIIGGFGVEFAIHKKIALEIDGLYFEKGCVFERVLPLFSSNKVKYELRGLSFPVLLRARLFSHPLPYFLAGMDFSLILSHERTSFLGGEASMTYEEVGNEDLQLATRRFDIGPVIGIGFEVPLSKGLLSLEGRYQLGLTNILNWYQDDQHKARTRTLLILVAYKI
jgi:hypothetical protein